MKAKKTYVARARRSGEWWAIEVPDVPGVFSQARRLEQVESMARGALALFLDVERDSFGLTLQYVLDDSAQAIVTQALEARTRANLAQAEASSAIRKAVRTLTGSGMTVRDAGELVGVSHQRVAQLLEGETPFEAATRTPGVDVKRQYRGGTVAFKTAAAGSYRERGGHPTFAHAKKAAPSKAARKR